MKKREMNSMKKEVRNGYVEILESKNNDFITNDSSINKFLAKLIIEDKNLQIKK